MKLVLATANSAKVREIERILTDFDIMTRPSDVPDIVEDAGTYVGNARLKAQAIMNATGEVAVADDAGIELEALGGLPGVESAHFAGPQASDVANRKKILDLLTPDKSRRAIVRSIAYAAFPDGNDLYAEGIVHGTLAHEERGTHGFGYDPLFIPDVGDGRTYAEMTPEEKLAISHRGKSFRALADLLRTRAANND